MKVENQKQFIHEHTAWQRRLEFLRQENALLKYRLSEMVDFSGEKDFLQMAEYFQNELLIKDEALNNLIREIKNFPDGPNTNEDLEEIIDQYDKLRNCIAQFEEEFLHLANEFNQKMLKNNKS